MAHEQGPTHRYADAPHLLPAGVAETIERLRILELEEPKKDGLDAYANWGRQMDRARSELRADLVVTLASSRVIARTTTAAAQSYSDLSAFDWAMTLFDEAGQIIPAAAALATFARRSLYAGDPNQLSAVVQSADERTQQLLGKTAFDAFRKRARSIFLDEQSRMAPPICDAVSGAAKDRHDRQPSPAAAVEGSLDDDRHLPPPRHGARGDADVRLPIYCRRC